jgi:class 3 adenylate cyclase
MILRSLKSILKAALAQETAAQPFSGVGTVFLSNVVNFEIPDDGIDPVRLATEMNTTFAATHDIISDAGGLIVTSVGDALLAVWGPSFVAPSHAELALACGRKILECLRVAQGKSKLPYSLRIVLATGKLAGRSVGGRFQVSGDPLAVAKRLETLQISKRGQILCTSETLAHIPSGVRSEPVGRVKGAAGNEVTVFEFS